jgi:hypothetical protein
LEIGGQNLFITAPPQTIYPDFRDDRKGVIGDAKYKPIGNIDRDDYYQLISYIYRYDFGIGIFLYPESEKIIEFDKNVNNLDRTLISKIGLEIPKIKETENYGDFVKNIEINEKIFINTIKEKFENFSKISKERKFKDSTITDFVKSLDFNENENEKIMRHINF